MKNSLFLAPVPFFWCDKCHTPVMGKLCSCGEKTRPAFDRDRNLVNRLFEEQFGVPLIPDGFLAILNKVHDEDRMEEIIIGGAVVCAIRYIPAES